MIGATRDVYVYTDYPLLGEEGLKKVKLLSYDENKYCWVEYNGVAENIKSGYLYNYKNLNKELKWVCPYSLLLSNKDYAVYLRGQRHKTTYETLVKFKDGDHKDKNFSTLKKALSFYRKLDDTIIEYAFLRECVDRFNTRGLVVLEGDNLYCENIGGKSYSKIKASHIGRIANFKQWRKV
tara:strand:+ start:2233 stop:2772 length:540 start_codon:yes stop_codon:yes gene_type:complete